MYMDLRPLTDAELLSRLHALAAQERESVADVVEHLAELERRDCVADTGCGTLFDYCRRILGYSEQAALARARAAHAALQTPRVLDDLRSGRVHLDALMRLAPLLPAEGERLLDLAAGATSRQVQSLVAGIRQESPVERDVIRGVSAPPPGDDAVIPHPARLRLSFTADEALVRMLERLRGLRRQRFPEGRLEDILKEAVEAWLARCEPRRRGRPPARAPGEEKKRSRRIPAAVRAFVWERDGGRCAYVSPEGVRCERTELIQFDHIVPWSKGGPSIAENLRLLCRPHNLRLARRAFGGLVPKKRVQVCSNIPAHGSAQAPSAAPEGAGPA